MEIDHFGVEDIMLIPQERMQKRIEAYIKNQLHEDKFNDQMTLRGFEDPFMGSK